MLRKLFKSTGDLLQFLLIFASLASCFTLVTSVGAKGIVWGGNQLEKHEETIDYLASNSAAIFSCLFLFNVIGLGVETRKNYKKCKEAELKAQRDKEQCELLERRLKAERELQRKQQAQKDRIHAETMNQCKGCDFYCGSLYLKCAVHPNLKHNCLDFEPKGKVEPVKLEIIQPDPVAQAELEEERRCFRVSDFTHAEFLYCILVMEIDDFHEVYLCERALIARYDEIHEDLPAQVNAPWDSAIDLTLEQVTDLQERLSTLSDDERRWFLEAINTFVAIG